MSSVSLKFLASAPRGFADLLARELTSFGASDVRERSTGVSFTGPLEVAYRACLESRLANRVFVEIAEFEAGTADEFYAWAKRIPWAEHIGPGATLACDFTGKHPAITHTHFGALKLKDAIVDALRDTAGFRPDVSLEQPSVRVHAHANRSLISVSIDLSGESLHRRGYRGAGGEGAAERERRGGRADARRLARHGGGGRGVSRSHVRIGDVCDRGSAHRRRRCARLGARLLRLPGLASTRCGAVEEGRRGRSREGENLRRREDRHSRPGPGRVGDSRRARQCTARERRHAGSL